MPGNSPRDVLHHVGGSPAAGWGRAGPEALISADFAILLLVQDLVRWRVRPLGGIGPNALPAWLCSQSQAMSPQREKFRINTIQAAILCDKKHGLCLQLALVEATQTHRRKHSSTNPIAF